MKDSDYRLIESLVEDYSLQIRRTSSACEVLMNREKDKLTIEGVGNEYIVSSREWHEHCNSTEELNELLSGLLSGSVQIAIKYRGNIPVGHQVQSVKEGKITVLGESGVLLSPFWLKKRYSLIDYSGGKKHIRAI